MALSTIPPLLNSSSLPSELFSTGCRTKKDLKDLSWDSGCPSNTHNISSNLDGIWVNEKRGERCYIETREGGGYLVRKDNKLTHYSRIGRFLGDDCMIALTVPHRNTWIKKWFGTVDQGGTRIVWKGPSLKRTWHKIA